MVTRNFFLYNHQQHLDVCRQTNQTYFRTLHVSNKGAEIRNFLGGLQDPYSLCLKKRDRDFGCDFVCNFFSSSYHFVVSS